MYFVVFSILVGTFSKVHSKSNIYWTNVNENALLLIKSEPAGMLEDGTELYPCKMWGDNRWLIGSFFFLEDHERSVCTMVTYGQVYKTKEFKVLIFPPGSVSWVRSTGKYPENPVEGGAHRKDVGEPGYLCRAKSGNSLLVGMAHANCNSCYMPQDDKEIHVGNARDIEILTENRYGKLFDKTFPRS